MNEARMISPKDHREFSSMSIPSCRICSHFFSIRGLSPVDQLRTGVGSRIPLLLNCGHAVCDGCVRSAITRATAGDSKKKKAQPAVCTVECGDCKHATELPVEGMIKPMSRNAASFLQSSNNITDETLFKMMPVDYYTLGLLVSRKKESEKKGDGIEFVSAVSKTKEKEKMLPKKSGVFCEECTRSLADLFCRDCAHNYCTRCFKTGHQTRLFSTHTYEPVQASSIRRPKAEKVCSTHNKRLEFYCKDDKTDTCADCAVIGEHKGHELISFADKIKRESEAAYLAGYQARKRIAYTLKCLQSLGPELKRRSNDGLEIIRGEILKQIRNLQLLEVRTSKAIHERTESQIVNADKIIEDLQSEAVKVESLIAEVEASLRVPLTDMSEFNSVVEELSSYADFPSLLSSEFLEHHRSDEEITRAGQISVELGLVTTSVKEYVESCTEDILGDSLRLVRPSELSENGLVKLQRAIETLDELPATERLVPSASSFPSFSLTSLPPLGQPLSVSRASSSASVRRNDDAASQDEAKPPSLGLFDEDEIQFNKPVELQKRIDKRIADKKATIQNQKISVCHIESPDNFFVQRLADRAKYLEREVRFNEWADTLAPGDEIPKDIEKGQVYLAQSEQFETWYRAEVLSECGLYSEGDDTEGKIFQVLYIDYGNMEKIEDRRLRNLPDPFKGPGIAVKCCLDDLVPWDEDTKKWTTEAIEDFRGYALLGTYDMTVYRKHQGIHYVDFGRPPRPDVVEDGVASVRDAMVWLNHGKFKNPHPAPKIAGPGRQFFTLDAFPKNEEHFCAYGYVESPSNFCLQLWTAEDKSNIQALGDISHDMQLFYATDASANLGFFAVQKGAICAAIFQDKLWYRAVVLEALPQRRARVLYVDYGNTWVVPLSFIRKIPQKFVDLPAQAVKCKLADISPVDIGGTWSPAAKKRLTELTENNPNLACVIDTVELSANEFGQSVAILTIVLEEKGPKFNTWINALLVQEGLARSTGPSSRIAAHRRPDVDVLPVSSSYVPEKTQRSETAVIPNVIASRPASYKVMVKLEHIESPQEVYVRLLDSPSKINLEDFSEYMNQVPEVTSVEELKKAKKVAYYDKSERSWKRAVVKDFTEGNDLTFAKIHLIDHGPTMTVPALDLRPIANQRFVRPANVLHKMSVAGVKAPGGTGKWPAKSIQEFSDRFLGKELTCEKIDTLADGVLLVRFFEIRDVAAGPFDPLEQKEFSIAKTCVEDGIAIPDESYDETERDEEKVSEESDIEEEPEPELCDWKPAEPFASKEFEGRVTWVDMNCRICIQDINAAEENLSMLGRLLTLKYKDSDQKPYDLYYCKGDVCIARFSSDGIWYRARIIDKSIEPGKYDVEFVDYGNEEVVEVKDLRKNTFMEDLVIQQNRCDLFNVAPLEGDTWPYKVLTYIHTTIVDKIVTVKVRNFENIGETPQVSLILSNGMNLGERLVKDNLARWKNAPIAESPARSRLAPGSSHSVVRSEPKYNLPGFENYVKACPPPQQTYLIDVEACLSDTDSEEEVFTRGESPDCGTSRTESYHKIPSIFGQWQFPGESLVPVEVCAVHDPVRIFVQPRAFREEEEKYLWRTPALEWASRVMPFIQLSKSLNMSGSRLPSLDSFEVGTACAALYTDGNWYRGIIAEDGEKPVVYFTDYGNHDPIDKESIRRCLPSLACHAPYGTYATLDRIEFRDDPPPSQSKQSYMDFVNATLLQVLLEAKERLWGRFKLRDGAVFVELFDFRSGTTFPDLPLAYEALIEEGYFQLEEDDISFCD